MENNSKLEYSEGIISIFTNILLFILKYWAGIVSGSIALIADAWHTLSDSLSSIIVIIGIKLSLKKADKEHPFGHGRWEQITAIFIGFLLAIVAYEFAKESIKKFNSHESANFGLIAIIVTIISILIKEGLAQYALWIYRKTKNTTIKADAWHHRSDALSSLVVLIGIFLRNFFWWIDSALGFIISLMIFYAVFDIIKEAINKLLGEEPSKELLQNIMKIIKEEDQNMYAHHFHIHHYGKHKELTFHIKLDETTSIKKGHDIASRIENNIMKELDIEATIHIEPVKIENIKN